MTTPTEPTKPDAPMSDGKAVKVRLSHDERMRAEGAMNALDVAGERIARLEAEVVTLRGPWETSPEKQLAEQDAEIARLTAERDHLISQGDKLEKRLEYERNLHAAENAELRVLHGRNRATTCSHCSGDMNKNCRCSHGGLCVSIEEFDHDLQQRAEAAEAALKERDSLRDSRHGQEPCAYCLLQRDALDDVRSMSESYRSNYRAALEREAVLLDAAITRNAENARLRAALGSAREAVKYLAFVGTKQNVAKLHAALDAGKGEKA